MDWNVQRHWRAFVGLILCFVLLESQLSGQAAQELRILVLEGSGTLNAVTKVSPKPISVRILDRNNKPVPDATVVFTMPEKGPGGDFQNGSNSMIVFTNAMGIAVAERYRSNATPGSYQIQVRATYMDQSSTLAIRQTNVEDGKSFPKMILIAAAAGGAAAAAFALKGGNQSPSTGTMTTATTPAATAPTIVFGGATVGPPR